MTDETMSEGKAKKPGFLRRILWWLWVILLLGLLLACIVFAAPWKVITLIAIFLAGATILPRVYRKWFWLGVGIVVLAIIAWIFLPDDNKDWRPYTFDKELAQIQAKYAVPDSENAAIAYNKILENWKQKEANEPNLPRNWKSIAMDGFWLSKDQPEIAAYIKYHQDTIDRLIQIGQFKRCTFPISANIIMEEQLERNSAIRKWAHLLTAAGNNNIAEVNTKDAIEQYLAVIRMGQHLSQQPNSLDMLIGIACEAVAMGGINNFVVCGDANEFYLGKLEEAVSGIKHNWNSDLRGFIDSDKLMFKNLWGGMCYRINTKGRTGFNHDPTGMIKEQTGKVMGNEISDINDIFSGYWWKILMKSYTILYWFYMPSTPETLGEIIDASFEKHYMMTKPDFSWSKESEMTPEFHYKINIQQLAEEIAKINKGVYPGLHDSYLRTAAQQRGTLLIIALRRYKNANGNWPEKLEDINNLTPAETFVDPLNNSSFVYKRTDDGFTLYGKGENGIDEEGKYENNWPAKPGADDLLIWPHKNKVLQRQEQKAND